MMVPLADCDGLKASTIQLFGTEPWTLRPDASQPLPADLDDGGMALHLVLVSRVQHRCRRPQLAQLRQPQSLPPLRRDGRAVDARVRRLHRVLRQHPAVKTQRHIHADKPADELHHLCTF